MRKGRDVVSVDDLIANRKKAKRAKKLRFFLSGLALFLFTSCIGVTYYLYFAGTSALTSTFVISGTKILSDEFILTLSKSSYQSIFLTQNAAVLRQNIRQDRLIQDVIVSMEVNNVIRIQVLEKPVLAIWMDEGKLLISDGSILDMKPEYAKVWLQTPGIYGYADTKILAPLLTTMRGLSKEGLGNVSEIHLAPNSYDENYVKIIMHDGNRIFTSLKTLDMLQEYPRIINALKTKNSCIFFDEMTRTAFSQPCEK